MTAGIHQALINLNAKLDKLEQTAAQVKRPAGKTGQPDLFSVVSGQKKPANIAPGSPALDARMLASRLDSAISKVEQILKEGKA